MKVLRVGILLLILFSLVGAICYGQTAEDYLNKGIAYGYEGMLDDAIVEYKKAIEINPNNRVAHGNLAIAYYYTREYSLAVRHCDKAIDLGYQVHPEFLRALEPYRKEGG